MSASAGNRSIQKGDLADYTSLEDNYVDRYLIESVTVKDGKMKLTLSPYVKAGDLHDGAEELIIENEVRREDGRYLSGDDRYQIIFTVTFQRGHEMPESPEANSYLEEVMKDTFLGMLFDPDHYGRYRSNIEPPVFFLADDNMEKAIGQGARYWKIILFDPEISAIADRAESPDEGTGDYDTIRRIMLNLEPITYREDPSVRVFLDKYRRVKQEYMRRLESPVKAARSGQ